MLMRQQCGEKFILIGIVENNKLVKRSEKMNASASLAVYKFLKGKEYICRFLIFLKYP